MGKLNMALYQGLQKIPQVRINGCANTVLFRKRRTHVHRFMLVMFETEEGNIYTLIKSHHGEEGVTVGFDTLVLK